MGKKRKKSKRGHPNGPSFRHGCLRPDTEAATPVPEGRGPDRVADQPQRGRQAEGQPYLVLEGQRPVLRILPACLTRLCLIEAVAEDVLQAGIVGGRPEHEAGLGPACSIQRHAQ